MPQPQTSLRHPLRRRYAPGSSTQYPPEQENDKRKQQYGGHDDMPHVADSCKHPLVPVYPGLAAALPEEYPRLGAASIIGDDAVQSTLGSGEQAVVLLPHGGDKPLAAGIVHCHIREEVVVIVFDQAHYGERPERMVCLRADDVVAQRTLVAVDDEDVVGEQRVEASLAALGGKEKRQ